VSAVRRDGGVTGLGVLPGLWRVILDQCLNGNYGSVEVPRSVVPECSEPDGRDHPQMAGTTSSRPCQIADGQFGGRAHQGQLAAVPA